MILAALGCALAAAAQPTPASWAVGVPVLLAGLALRGWAFHHLGPAGRTRHPEPPSGRVVTGPYALVPHPVYLANYALALGLVLVADPPPVGLAVFLGAVAVLYGVLARRESAQTASLPVRPSAALGLRGVMRSERSTWLSVAALLGAQVLAGALRGPS